MEALVLDERTAASLIAERKRLGLDRFDEVHAGRYVINASPNSSHGYLVMETGFVLRALVTDTEVVVDQINVGEPDDHRIPDVAIIRRSALGQVWHGDGDCVVAVEVLSPGERGWIKNDHYRSRGVATYLEIDPVSRTVSFEGFEEWQHAATSIAEAVAEALGLSVA